MGGEYELVCDLSNSTIFTDFKQPKPITHISRSRQYSTPNMSLTVEDRQIFRLTMDN